jgi:adenosylcobinamide-phosphate synthase
MTLLSILCVLVIEQFQAAPVARMRDMLITSADYLERQFNGGESRHGMTAWVVGVGVPVVLVLIAQIALASLHPLLALVLDVSVLYLMMGFRQFSHFFTDIQMALRLSELERARQLLALWHGRNTDRLGSSEIVRLAIEQGILSSYRHVFAPLFWFIFIGPAGALLYRLSLFVAKRWSDDPDLPAGESGFGTFAGQIYEALDWLPVRLTAITFAVVGDFEDAVFCWRSQSGQWQDAASGILLSSGAGALGVRLGLPLSDVTGVDVRPELGVGEDADVEHLQSATGLVWRALVLSLLMLALLTVASWVGA